MVHVSSPEGIEEVCRQANVSPACVGVVTWMHTFSPAKMWISGLRVFDIRDPHNPREIAYLNAPVQDRLLLVGGETAATDCSL